MCWSYCEGPGQASSWLHNTDKGFIPFHLQQVLLFILIQSMGLLRMQQRYLKGCLLSDLVSWTFLIVRNAQNGQPNEAI